MISRTLSKARKSLIGCISGAMLLSSFPRYSFSDDWLDAPFSGNPNSVIMHPIRAPEKQEVIIEKSESVPKDARESNNKSYLDSIRDYETYEKERMLEKENERKSLEEELKKLSFEEKRAIYSDNRLSVKTNYKEYGDSLSVGRIIKGLNVTFGLTKEEQEPNWWRIYRGEREISNAYEFYSMLENMDTTTSKIIDSKRESCYKMQYDKNEKWKRNRKIFGALYLGVLGAGLIGIKGKKGHNAKIVPGIAIALGGYGAFSSFAINSYPLIEFKYFFGYEYPNRSWLNIDKVPHKDYSYEFTLEGSKSASEEYNVELRERLGIESSELRKRLGLQ